MKAKTHIKIMAAALLVVFSLSTLVNFACSLGLNMGFNAHHHAYRSKSKVSGCCEEKNSCDDNSAHHDITQKEEQPKNDDCCTNGVLAVQKFDKDLNQKTFVITGGYFIRYFSSHIIEQRLASIMAKPEAIRFLFPPPGNIRIEIQSFQI